MRVQCHLCDQEFSNARMQSNLSCGRRACSCRESSSIPNTVSLVEGPSSLAGCRGIPHSLNLWTQISKLRLHFCEFWRTQSMKVVIWIHSARQTDAGLKPTWNPSWMPVNTYSTNCRSGWADGSLRSLSTLIGETLCGGSNSWYNEGAWFWTRETLHDNWIVSSPVCRRGNKPTALNKTSDELVFTLFRQEAAAVVVATRISALAAFAAGWSESEIVASPFWLERDN